MGTVAQEIARIQGAKAALKTAIEGKGVTVPSSTKIDGYAALVDSIQQGGGTGIERKDVNFYDYDGTVVASYTAQEFADLSALPANPTHEGLTSQGWNWTLSDAKTYVASYGKLEIGQMYVTSDGRTRLYITIPADNLKMGVYWTQTGQSTIYWGDGSSDVVPGTGIVSVTNHVYSHAGDYVISIDSGENTIAFRTDIPPLHNSGARLSYLRKLECGRITSLGIGLPSYPCLETIALSNSVTSLGRFSACRCIKHITVPSSVETIENMFLYQCYSLRSVSLPKTITGFGGSQHLLSCYYLDRLCFPSGITSVPEQFANYLMFINDLVIPEGVTVINGSAFANEFNLVRVDIPSTVTSIGANAFSACSSLSELIVRAATPPSITNSTLSGVSSELVTIYVPAASVDAYKAASYWSVYSNRIQAIPE